MRKYEMKKLTGTLFFLTLLPVALCRTGEPSENSNQKAAPEKSKAWKDWKDWKDWEGKFSDGTPLTEQKLDELLAMHKVWFFGIGTGGSRLVLRRADLQGAYLYRADLQRADLQRADLQRADLQGASLWGADLRGAKLMEADLRGATLIKAQLRETKMWDADLQGALYEPERSSLPDLESLSTAPNLEKMRFMYSPQGMVELREAFKEGGFREGARKIT